MINGMINMVGTFFIKASTYEFMKKNDLGGGDSYYYSFEHYGNASLMSNLWANFVIYGDPTSPEFPIRLPDTSKTPTSDVLPAWPVWKDEDMHYLKIDPTPELRRDYITTWEDPESKHGKLLWPA